MLAVVLALYSQCQMIAGVACLFWTKLEIGWVCPSTFGTFKYSREICGDDATVMSGG
jgi:hypothetical protein